MTAKPPLEIYINALKHMGFDVYRVSMDDTINGVPTPNDYVAWKPTSTSNTLDIMPFILVPDPQPHVEFITRYANYVPLILNPYVPKIMSDRYRHLLGMSLTLRFMARLIRRRSDLI